MSGSGTQFHEFKDSFFSQLNETFEILQNHTFYRLHHIKGRMYLLYYVFTQEQIHGNSRQ